MTLCRLSKKNGLITDKFHNFLVNIYGTMTSMLKNQILFSIFSIFFRYYFDIFFDVFDVFSIFFFD